MRPGNDRHTDFQAQATISGDKLKGQKTRDAMHKQEEKSKEKWSEKIFYAALKLRSGFRSSWKSVCFQPGLTDRHTAEYISYNKHRACPTNGLSRGCARPILVSYASESGAFLTFDNAKYQAGTITNKTTSKTYNFTPIPPFMQELIDAGGLMNFAVNEIKGK